MCTHDFVSRHVPAAFDVFIIIRDALLVVMQLLTSVLDYTLKYIDVGFGNITIVRERNPMLTCKYFVPYTNLGGSETKIAMGSCHNVSTLLIE